MGSKPRARKAGPGGGIVSLKITLRGVKPPVWRRLLAPATLTLGELHHAIQAAMGWFDGHLHAFEIDGEQYGDPEQLEDMGDDEARVTLAEIVKSGVARFTYEYDFGDGWQHLVEIEKTLPAVAGESYPRCVAGKRNCPPEDCGGVGGYEELLEILAAPEHPERAERLEWLGGEFDPEEFDLAEVNKALAATFKNSRRG